MKIVIILLTCFNCLTVFNQEITLNTNNTKVAWTGYGELGSFKQEGTIKIKGGSLSMEKDMIKYAEVIIDMKSIQHSDKSLADHLVKKDFFWVKKYPTASLQTTAISCEIITANLTIRDITLPIQFPYEIDKSGSSIRITGKITIDRTQYDIKYNSSSYFQDLGNYAIKNEFDLSFEINIE